MSTGLPAIDPREILRTGAMTDQDIGGRIREARERRGLSLSDAAASTKLSVNVLRAIEGNDFASLPEGMYRRAYLRTVAAEVGLDPNAVVAEYDELHRPVSTPPSVSTPDQWIEQPTPSRRGTLVAIAIFAIVMVGWFRAQPDDAPVTVPFAERGKEADVVRTSFNKDAVAVAADRGAIDARQVPATAIKIEIATTGPCWVTAESDGKRVEYRLVNAGERVVVQGERKIALRLGDAGAVTVSINDGPPQTPGAAGQVIAFDISADALTGPWQRAP
jgi:cytoskeletal protein RodZ